MSQPPPPPPPPHGENPKTTAGGSGLPPGKYDIFIIPEHSAGSGFLYLPSLKPQWNSFIAGVASTLMAVVIGNSLAPAIKAWWAGFQGIGNAGLVLLMLAIGLGAWSLGKSQTEKEPSGSSQSPGGSQQRPPGGGFNQSGGYYTPPPNGAPPPNQAPPPPPPPQHEAPRNDRPNPGQSWQEAPRPEPRPQPPPPPPPQPEPKRHEPEPPKPQPQPQAQPKPQPTKAPPPPRPSATRTETPKGAWEKAREETRRREEERKAKEAEAKRREETARRLRELREREAKEREQREKEARERDTRERLRKEQEARDKERMEKEVREKVEKELREKVEKEAREAREKEEAKKREEERARLQAARERETKERLERQRKEEEEKNNTRKGSSYAFSSVGEKTSMWPNGKPPAATSTSTPAGGGSPASTARPAASPSPTKPAAARSATGTEDTFSYRPYDKPKKPGARKKSVSDFSESSWAPSASTARTTPPPSMRGPYSTNDPQKIVIKAVYGFLNQFSKTPASQLISGVGTVTDGLILRITSAGLFVDDDVRGVAQREWDVKAWTIKLVEVWCPTHAVTSTPGSVPTNHPFFKAIPSSSHRRAAERGATKTFVGEEAFGYLEEFGRACKDTCSLGPSASASSAGSSVNSDKTGEWRAKGLHLLRITMRDQEGKRHLFVISEEESWKIAKGLQTLRSGSQVRALNVAGFSGLEAKGCLETLGWG